MRDIRFGNRYVGEKHPVYIIAEIGLNHRGKFDDAIKLIDASIEAGCDCVKFQKRSLKNLYTPSVLENPERQEHPIQYLLEHIVSSELSEDDMRKLHAYSISKGVDFSCTPWDRESMNFLKELDMPFFKIGSPDMTNLPLIRETAKNGRPLIISTGMSFATEIWEVIESLSTLGVPYVMLHCNSTYPAPLHDINLNFLRTLQEKTPYPIGYSGHDQSIGIAVAAVALGARVIEKHISLDKTQPGPDQKASLEPGEFAEMVKNIRQIETALGDFVRFPSRGEFLNREHLSKSVVASRLLKKGETITLADLEIRSPGKGTSPLKMDFFIGKTLNSRDIDLGECIKESDVFTEPDEQKITKGIKRHWGVVARMCDIDSLLHCESPYVEIHLSDKDVHNDVVNDKQYDRDLVVHAPEYDGDLLLDISSLDERVRQQSVAFMNKTLEHGRHLKSIFKNGDQKVKFVVHPGGMNMDAPLLRDVDRLYDKLLQSLRELNAEGFELLVENMPACPWYFGGQWFHASFMDAGEIADFSRRSGFGIVFDTSHAGLYCNYYKKDMQEYAEKILPVTKYIHVSDAAGFGGEGLQIGDGSIDFKKLLPRLIESDFWILPEIWQGHKFGGEGFLKAVESLKNIHPDF